MGVKIFLAGATGVIGRSLIPLLRDAGHSVTGMTRSQEGKAMLEGLGIQAVTVDIFDSEELEKAMKMTAPEVVMHQVTDLSSGIDPASPEAALERNARIRREGTANLARAASNAGAKRVIAQSIAWAYRPKDPPYYSETDPLDATATGSRAISVCKGVIPLENAILQQSDFEGIVLRYGHLYGPDTWSPEPNGLAPVHVHAAAYAALLAIDHGRTGAYNIANPGGAVSVERAMTELSWDPNFRLHENERADGAC